MSSRLRQYSHPTGASSARARRGGQGSMRLSGPRLSARKQHRRGCALGGPLRVDPPGEVDEQLVEHPGEEFEVGRASIGRRAPSPRVNRRVASPELTLVGGSCRWGAVYHSRRSSSSWRLAPRGRGAPSCTQWNAGPRREPGVTPRVGHEDSTSLASTWRPAACDHGALRRGAGWPGSREAPIDGER